MAFLENWYLIIAGIAGLLIILFVKIGDWKMEKLKRETDIEVAKLVAMYVRFKKDADRYRRENPEAAERADKWLAEMREARKRRG